MRKIAITANTSWYIYNFRRSTIQAFIGLGCEVACLSPLDDYTEKLVGLGCSWHPLRVKGKSVNPVDDIFMMAQLFYLFARFRPDYCFNFTVKNNIYGVWVARVFGVRVINNITGLGTSFIHNNLTSLVVKILYKVSQKYADTVFCQNPDDYNMLLELGLVPKEKLRLLPGSGVNLKMFTPRERRRVGQFCFLYVGRMLKDKGLFELVEAFVRIDQNSLPCVLKLCGFVGAMNVSAISEDAVKKWAENPNIIWMGVNDDMPSVYAEADCVVLPSYREGMPRSLLEAGAMGLPSITTDVPGCRNIISDGYNGYICNVRDVGSLQAAMINVLGLSDEELLNMSRNARAHVVENFDENIVVQEAVFAVERGKVF